MREAAAADRVFDGDDFVFANPSCIYGPDEGVPLPAGAEYVEAQLRLAVVIGAGIRGSKIALPGRALAALPGAIVVEGLANPVAS